MEYTHVIDQKVEECMKDVKETLSIYETLKLWYIKRKREKSNNELKIEKIRQEVMTVSAFVKSLFQKKDTIYDDSEDDQVLGGIWKEIRNMIREELKNDS